MKISIDINFTRFGQKDFIKATVQNYHLKLSILKMYKLFPTFEEHTYKALNSCLRLATFNIKTLKYLIVLAKSFIQ